MSEVLLVVYDLSGGMARSLSAQFLGPNHSIEMIPHTGLLVFGNEYFFGGGIQSVEPHYFRAMRGIHPVQTQRLGITSVSQTAFDDWCRGIASRKYNAATYDLLHRNCNHFSHDAALQGLKLNQGVPSWILEVPQKFLSSPMGQMIRPMLEQMQISQPMAPAIQPVRGAPNATSVVVAPVFAAGTAVVNVGTLGQQSAATNPWADNWSTPNRGTTAPAHAAAGTTSSCQGSPTTVDVDWKPTSRAITPPVTSSRSDSVLRKYTKPMLSNDTKSMPICVAKLSSHLSDQTSTALQSLSRVLQGAAANPSGSDSSHVPMVVTALWKLIQEGRGASFALLYLRLVVLSFSSTAQVGEVMSELMTTLSDVSSTVFQTPASKSLAWCVASNYAGSTAVEKMASPIPSVLVDAAIRDWNHDSVQVRQAACTFLYNFVVCNGTRLDEDEETVVSLVCSSLESLIEETDPTTRLRRLLVGSRVVFGVHHPVQSTTAINKSPSSPSTQTIEGATCNEMAKDLVQDLGFVSLLQELAATDYDSHSDTLECRELAYELMERLQN